MATFRFHEMPSEAKVVLEQALGSVALTVEVTGDRTLKPHLDAVESVQLEYFNVHAQDLHMLASLRELEPVGWAVMVKTTETMEHDSDYSLAHIARRDGRFRFTHLQHGWVPKAVLQILDHARGTKWLASSNFSPALLHEAGLRRLWLWCRAKDQTRDRLIPLDHRDGHAVAKLRGISAVVLQKRLQREWNNQPQVSNAPGTAQLRTALVQLQPVGPVAVTRPGA